MYPNKPCYLHAVVQTLPTQTEYLHGDHVSVESADLRTAPTHPTTPEITALFVDGPPVRKDKHSPHKQLSFMQNMVTITASFIDIATKMEEKDHRRVMTEGMITCSHLRSDKSRHQTSSIVSFRGGNAWCREVRVAAG